MSEGAETARDRESVRALLGREPLGSFEVVVRDAAGEPVVIRNAPLLDDGTPMPTRYWLVGPTEVLAVSRLEAAGGAEEVGPGRSTVRGDDLDERHPAGGHGAGLVQDDGVDASRRLEYLGPLDQDAQLRTAAGADEKRCWRGQSQRAGARDDQYGDGGGERHARRRADGKPAD